MKSVETISTELNNKLVYITGYERTKILVIVDRVITKPWSNHRMDLRYYSIRYKANDKQIYVYNKTFEINDDFDYDYIDSIEFPDNFNIRITIDSLMELIIRIIKFKIKRIFKF